MNKIEYIAFDTETGGTDPRVNPILTAYFTALDENLNMLDELSLAIKPFEGSIIEEEALAVNKINMEEHLARPDLLLPEQAAQKLIEFIKKCHHHNGGKKYDKARPLGHNISFDLRMVQEQLIPMKNWEEHVSYRFCDSMIVANFLKDVGMLPKEVGSLESLVKFYEIDNLGSHDAKNDVKMTAMVYVKIRDSIANLKNNSSSQPKLNLLQEIE